MIIFGISIKKNLGTRIHNFEVVVVFYDLARVGRLILDTWIAYLSFYQFQYFLWMKKDKCEKLKKEYTRFNLFIEHWGMILLILNYLHTFINSILSVLSFTPVKD